MDPRRHSLIISSGKKPCVVSGFTLVCLIGTSDFDAQMCGIKFWKGDENLRPVFRKEKKIEWLPAFWTFEFIEIVHIDSSLR
jgi:hypothetical protein